MNETELGWIRELLALFDRACAAANVSYFLYGGSLLGFRSNLVKNVGPRLRDLADLLLLVVGTSSRNLGPTLLIQLQVIVIAGGVATSCPGTTTSTWLLTPRTTAG